MSLHMIYEIKGTRCDPAEAGSQRQLESAYRASLRPACLCCSAKPPMYVARHGGQFIVKRMPGTGALHAPHCPAYAPPVELSGRGRAAAAIKVVSTDLVIRLAVPLTANTSLDRSNDVPPTSKATAGDAVIGNPATSSRLSLLGLLHLLWDEASLNVWSPGMTGKRRWPVVRHRLLEAAQDVRVGRRRLRDHLFVPPPWREHSPQEACESLRQRFLAQDVNAGQMSQQIIIGEMKTWTATSQGGCIVIKHLPGLQLQLSRQAYLTFISGMADAMALHQAGNPDKGTRLVVICLTTWQDGALRMVQGAGMTTTDSWLPSASLPAYQLLRALQPSRRMVVPLSYGLEPQQLPYAILTDTDPTTLCLGRPADAMDGYRVWLWEPSFQVPLPA